MFKVPNVSSGYSKDEIICAIKKRGYSQEEAEVIHRYGAMTIKELRMLFNDIDTLLTPMLSDADLRVIAVRAKNRKLEWLNHYKALIKASKFVSGYTEEVIEFILEDPATFILKQEYLLNSPTGKSLTDNEAYLLAVKKRLLRIEAERQLQTGTAKKSSMTNQTDGNGPSDSALNRPIPHEQTAVSYSASPTSLQKGIPRPKPGGSNKDTTRSEPTMIAAQNVFRDIQRHTDSNGKIALDEFCNLVMVSMKAQGVGGLFHQEECKKWARKNLGQHKLGRGEKICKIKQ